VLLPPWMTVWTPRRPIHRRCTVSLKLSGFVFSSRHRLRLGALNGRQCYAYAADHANDAPVCQLCSRATASVRERKEMRLPSTCPSSHVNLVHRRLIPSIPINSSDKEHLPLVAFTLIDQEGNRVFDGADGQRWHDLDDIYRFLMKVLLKVVSLRVLLKILFKVRL